MWGPNCLLLRVKLGVGSFLLIVWHSARVAFLVRMRLSLSYTFWGNLCVYFLFSLVCRNHSASFSISFRGNFSVYSCRFGAKRCVFRGLLCHNLGLEPPQIFKSIVNLEAWLLVAYPVSILSFLETGSSFIWDFRVYRYETVYLR